MCGEQRDEVRTQVAQLLSSVLGHPVSASDDVTSADDVAWDSLRQVEVIYSVEDAFNVRFEASEFPNLISLEMIVDAVLQHLS